ncbi:thiamine-monophosphate kinase [Methanobacterium formicicum DSM 3637]|uniref:Thiamine-monophosphate kinase n=2 Tax=Methanobacterium formicicum TaxID=2162 RepID=K2R2R4_METFP|nr:thiamine-monophosphate kinase [Methanobacterium formicicum DSM 3637]
MMPSKDSKHPPNLKISNIGEKKLIKRLLSRSRASQPNSPFFDEFYFKSLSDDAALIDLGDNYLVVTSDLLLESSHLPSDMSPEDRGRKVVTVNVSDLAAMGAKPIGFILSLGLPEDLPLNEFDEIMDGVLKSCQDYEMGLMGGDTNQSDELILSGTCLGIVGKNKVLMKEGARPGDVVAVTGSLGVAAAGFEFLLSPQPVKENLKKELRNSTLKLIQKQAIQPRARLKEGISLANTGAVTSATDITDGLASEVGELLEASKNSVGISLFETMIPITLEVEELATALDQDPLDLALYYGEDFELLLTIEKDEFKHLKDEFGLHQVGVVTDSGKMEIINKDGKTNILEGKGYQHFVNK